MLRTWWLPETPVTAGTTPWLLSSGAQCLWRKLTSRCLEFKIRTQATLSNRSFTTSRPLPVTFLQESWRWPPPLLATSPRGSVNSSLPCSRERFVDLLISSSYLYIVLCRRLSCIGTTIRKLFGLYFFLISSWLCSWIHLEGTVRMLKEWRRCWTKGYSRREW